MKYVDQIVGFFILFAIAALIAGIVFVGINQRLFQKNYNFTSKFATGSGLTIGMPVSLHGVEIGKLTKMKLDPDTLFVNVEFYIYDTYYEKVVLKNSVIELVSVLGITNQLVFHPGKIEGPPEQIKEGSYIPSNQTEEGQELERTELVEFASNEDSLGALIAKISPIMSQLQPILISVRRISLMVEDAMHGRKTNELGKLITSVNDSLVGNDTVPGGAILTNISNITAKLDSELVTMDTILKDISKLTANPKGLLVDLVDPKGSVKTILNDNNALYNDLSGMLSNTRKILEDLELFTKTISNTAPQLTSLVDEVNKTITQAQSVLEGLKNNPLLSGGITKEKEQPSTFQGYRDGDF
jgi:phospholipid/cholesterol/gamma-HCH transport system substrate-binding protein